MKISCFGRESGLDESQKIQICQSQIGLLTVENIYRSYLSQVKEILQQILHLLQHHA